MVKTIGNVQEDAQFRASASGALSNGDTVILNSDGTVSAVEETNNSATESLGSASVYSSSVTRYIASAYDSTNEKYVICYRDQADGYGKAIVASVSGTTLSFGSEVTFTESSTTYLDVNYDPDAGRIVLVYSDDDDGGKGKVMAGTVSGTSVSFGTAQNIGVGYFYEIRVLYEPTANKAVTFGRAAAGGGYGTAVVLSYNSGSDIYSAGTPVTFASGSTNAIDACFDSNRNQVIVAYSDYSNSQRGTTCVGTVSGTSISFNSETVFENDGVSTFDGALGIRYDATFSRVILAYAPLNTNYGEIALGTNSGTSVGVFNRQTFNGATTTTFVSLVHDSQANGAVIIYRDDGNNAYGTYRVATFNATGTAFTFGSETVFESASTNFRYGPSIDASNSKILIAYQDVGNNDNGTGIVLQNAYSVDVTNLTADNFIGFADGTYADTENAAINSTCAVQGDQTGLSAGQKYYVQTDGTLETTPDDPSVEAGTAISATRILVKG